MSSPQQKSSQKLALRAFLFFVQVAAIANNKKATCPKHVAKKAVHTRLELVISSVTGMRPNQN